MNKTVAILGPTASGKTALSIKVAKKLDAVVLSLDSLSVYKEIDIISAKPTIKEREGVVHLGIDEVFLDQEFNAYEFIALYNKAKLMDKNIVIVGGSGFYLKALIDGLSSNLKIDKINRQKAKNNSQLGYEMILKYDQKYAQKISPRDTYRIVKWLEIYYQFGISATEFFKNNPPNSHEDNIELYEIEIKRETLRSRILKRTEEMIKNGAIDEVAHLEYKYTRKPKAMNSIGIKEILGYFDGFYDIEKTKELISLHTYHLAKRQMTFNATQFKGVTKIGSDTFDFYI